MDGSKENPIAYFDDAGNGPHLHVCDNVVGTADIRDWLDRQKLLGITPEGERLIEQLIEDLA